MSGKGARGFTLIELMVAVVIFLIFIGAVYGIFLAGRTSMARAEEREELYQAGRVLLDQLSRELASAYQVPTATTSSLVGTDTEGGTDGVQEDQLSFLTTAHPATGATPASDLCQVTYLMGEGTPEEPAGLYLEENFSPGLEATTDEPERQMLSPLVVGFNCKYLPAEGDWETAWTDQTTLPMAVRIELTLQAKTPNAKPLVLVSTTNLTMATAPEAQEETTTGGTNAQP